MNFNGYDAIDRHEIAKHYKLTEATVWLRLQGSGIKPVAYFSRYYYPLIEVLDYFDTLPPVAAIGRPKRTATK